MMINYKMWDVKGGLYIRVEPGYNDNGLCDTSSTKSDILWYQLRPTVKHNITLRG